MYQSPVAFQAPLAPRNYFAEDAHAQDVSSTFETTWQLVGLKSSISKAGQYLSAELGSVPVVVRNFDGEITALRNVCSHRHCSLVSARQGESEKLKCPFHGWEFGVDGRTRKIPAAKNFPDFDRERYRLTSFPLEFCGDLMFVRASDNGPSLKEWLGDLYDRFEEWTTLPYWKPAVSRTLPLPANWKIPIEASLESYHIPEVHPKSFGEDPGEAKSEHAFGRFTTSFFTSFHTPRLIDKVLKVYEGFILKILGVPFHERYEHHHVFPNLLISHTDSLTLIQNVRPVSGTTSATDVWQYGRQSVRSNSFSKLTATLWGQFTAWLSYQILKEDIRIFSHVQRGEKSAVDHSLLGRCEERLHAFQMFVAERIQISGASHSLSNHSLTGSPADSSSCSFKGSAVTGSETLQ